MGMVSFKQHGNFELTTKYLKRDRTPTIRRTLDQYGRLGVQKLMEATPKDTGLTANSWSYKVYISKESISIQWDNSNFNKGVPIALVIQYGHVLPNGRYIEGIDYINPAMKPIFEDILDKVWKEVST